MSALYTSGKNALLTGANLPSDTINAYLVSSDYTFSAAHAAIGDIPTGNRKGPVALSGKSVSGGAFLAAATTWTAVNTPPANVRAVVLTIGTVLLAYVDDFGLGAGGTTIAFNGSDIIVTWAGTGVIRFP